MSTVVVFPYMPLRESAIVGGWRLLPGQREQDADMFTSPNVQALAKGLLWLYAPDKGEKAHGAYVAPPGGLVGDDVPVAEMPRLRRAVLLGLLESNPTPPALVEAGAEPDHNGAWKTVTSDNAVLWGHGIDDTGYTAVEYGEMVKVLSGGHNVLHADALKIIPPTELPPASMYGFFDAGYADAAYSVMGFDDEQARRIGRATDWLDYAWRNSSSVTVEMRVVLLRMGFEVLFGTEVTYDVRDALAGLLDDEHAEKRPRTWESRTGKAQAKDLSDLAWWFMQFSFLRNAIMHGDEVPPKMFEHDGQPHLWLAESRLRQTIKTMVAGAGHSDVLLDLRTREHQTRVDKVLKTLQRRDAESGGKTPDKS